MNLKGRHLLTLADYTSDEIDFLLELSKKFKSDKKSGTEVKHLVGKNIVLIFEKDSTRTRCAFEVSAFDQGAHVTYLGPNGSQIGKKESSADTARVLSRYYDGIQYRGAGQKIVETLAEFSSVPVWNGLTDDDHPTQMLADLLTAVEHVKKPLNKQKWAYVGDGRNNIANAMMITCHKMGIDFRIIAPKELQPPALMFGITITDDIESGVKDVDIIHTDVWVSMGEPDHVWGERIALLKPYQVTMDMLRMTGNPDVKFMHCLPSFHDLETKVAKEIHEKFGIIEMEVTNEVFESKHSIVFDQAENRLHTIKATIVATIKGEIKL